MLDNQSLLLLIVVNAVIAQHVERPNVVIIMADDMGLDDVSFRGSNQFLTPNIDALAFSGIILKNMYVPAMCTPSRAALLTGKYPINTGMQHYVIPNDQPWGLPTNESTMAQIFQQNGYYTSLIGKWHLGMSRRAYTPTQRGFDHHSGYLGAYIDYWNHTLYNPSKNYSRGHDFRNGLRVSHKYDGTYATEVLTKEAVSLIERRDTKVKPLLLILSHLAPHSGNEDAPLQAPGAEIAKFVYIRNKHRRTYAAMMSELDKSVGQVVQALSDKGILNNTIILFYSDNGGPTLGMHANTGSNYPLRGQKNSPWEGGLRSSAAIWSAQFQKLGSISKQRIYVADLLPTLAAAVGIKIDESIKLDGLNLWSALMYGYENVEREIVHNIDDLGEYYAYAKGNWKLIQGSTENGTYDGWYGTRPSDEIDERSVNYEQVIKGTSVWQQLSAFNRRSSTINIAKLRADAEVVCGSAESPKVASCSALNELCLFDIDADPCEQFNRYEEHRNAEFVHEMLARVQYFRNNARQPNNRPTDARCDPKNYNFEWTWWEDEVRKGTSSGASSYAQGVLNAINRYRNTIENDDV